MYKVIGMRPTRAIRVLWMLEEIGEPYQHVAVKPRSPEVMEASPVGKIPLLIDGDVTISDSVAIMTYLADRHGQLTYPAGTLDRARQDAMTLQILDEIESLLWMAAKHGFIFPEEHRVPEIKPSLKWEYAQNLERIERIMSAPFLMGDKMTIPDILLTHCLRWAEGAKFPEPGEAFVAFRERMEAREAFQRVLELP